MVGLGRNDLLLRGSRLWACGKCGFARNFSHRCKCLECGGRPTQWIQDLQAAKVKELAKKPGGAAAAGGGDMQPKPTAMEKELARLRAENAALKQSAPGVPATGKVAEEQPTTDEDAEYQARVDDLEAQMAALRKVARDAGDASFVNAALENLERRAAALRTERRAGWSVPRQLERQRARVAEREARVARATERVAELEVERAKLQADLDEARAHLAAKEEDLQAERAETTKLEKLLPTPVVAEATAAAAVDAIDLDAPDAERTVAELMRKLAARKGGAWGASLAALSVSGPTAVAAETREAHETEQRDEMVVDAGGGQNAQVPQKQELVANPMAGAALSLVPSLAKRPTDGEKVGATKLARRG